MLIIVFGENLPERFFERLYDFRRADLLLVMGTSLVVCDSILTKRYNHLRRSSMKFHYHVLEHF